MCMYILRPTSDYLGENAKDGVQYLSRMHVPNLYRWIFLRMSLVVEQISCNVKMLHPSAANYSVYG